ncbi:MAG TPA: DNA-binding protein WhiA [Clostridiaceae bacterium]|nr:DNA-binding protein WhiA [Clostridiaceae bacterium]
MSFSSSVKNELSRIDINESCCLLSELSAVIRVSGAIKVAGSGKMYIRIVTENAAFARRVFSLVKKQYSVYPEVIIRKSKKLRKHVSYILVMFDPALVKQLLDMSCIDCGSIGNNGREVRHNSIENKVNEFCCKKAYLRGAFLAGGSISDPEKTYHLEITTRSLKVANELDMIMNGFNLNSKVIKRKNSYIVYLKEGENIVDFLNIIGAHRALLELENIRILKEMRNNVNRIVNCETANLGKTVDASLRQVTNIKYIRDNIGFEKLPQGLRDIAELRLKYSDASLKELGEMLTPPLGKSGVNHRLRKLDRIAESLKKANEAKRK